MSSVNKIVIDTAFLTDNDITIEIRSTLKTLLDLDNEIKTKTTNSVLTIDPITNSNYEFPFDVPKEIKEQTHIKTQYITLMNQIKDTYGRLLRLEIKSDVANFMLPLSYKTNATLCTTKDDLDKLSGNTKNVEDLLDQIHEKLNSVYE